MHKELRLNFEDLFSLLKSCLTICCFISVWRGVARPVECARCRLVLRPLPHAAPLSGDRLLSHDWCCARLSRPDLPAPGNPWRESCGFCEKWPQTWCFQITEIYSLTFFRGRESKINAQAGLTAPPPLKAPGQAPPCLLRCLGAPGVLGLCPHRSVSASVSLLCVPQATLTAGGRVHPNHSE